MSIFPTTRIGRALVVSAVVVGVARIVPFLLQVFSLTGDELTELPPLTPAGTDATFLLANPVAWFLAVAAAVYLVLALRDVVVHLVSPPPPPPSRARARARARTTAARSGTKRTTATTSTRRPPSGRTATTRATKPKPKPRAAAATRSAGRPAPRTTTKRGSTTTRRTGTARRPASRR